MQGLHLLHQTRPVHRPVCQRPSVRPAWDYVGGAACSSCPSLRQTYTLLAQDYCTNRALVDGRAGMDARGRVLSPRQALERQLRTVSDQLAESLAELVGMDGQYPAAELPAGADPAAALLERVRTLEETAQLALQQHKEPGKVFAPTLPSLPRSPQASNPSTAEKRPAWGSPLGSASPRREQFAAARSRSAATSPRRSSVRSPSGSRSLTPTGRPPTPGKKRAEHQRESRAPRVDASVSTPPAEIETLSAWGNSDDADTLKQQAQSLSQTYFKDRVGSPADGIGKQTANAEQLSSKLPQTEQADATAASDRNLLEQRVADLEKELTSTKARLSRGKRTGSPSKRGRSPLPRRASSLAKTSPEEQTRAGKQATSPARSTSPGRGTEVILSRGSREEKERLLAQVAALQQGIADAEQRELPQSIIPCAPVLRVMIVFVGINAEIRGRQAAEDKTLEAEILAAELASALSVMTAHCEELERAAAAAAAREVEVRCTVCNLM